MSETSDTFWKEEQHKKKQQRKPAKPPRISIEADKIRNGLGKLILTVVELLRELMEKQAVRRIEAGALTDEEVERLGVTFMNLKEEVSKLKTYFELDDDDLQVALGPLTLRDDDKEGKASAVEILDRLLATGVIVRGDLLVSVAEVDLLSVNLGLLLASIDKARELYAASSTQELQKEIEKLRAENASLKNT
jgi:hypothetical protein